MRNEFDFIKADEELKQKVAEAAAKETAGPKKKKHVLRWAAPVAAGLVLVLAAGVILPRTLKKLVNETAADVGDVQLDAPGPADNGLNFYADADTTDAALPEATGAPWAVTDGTKRGEATEGFAYGIDGEGLSIPAPAAYEGGVGIGDGGPAIGDPTANQQDPAAFLTAAKLNDNEDYDAYLKDTEDQKKSFGMYAKERTLVLVSDSQGNPVSGARVQAGPFSAVTDAKGRAYLFDSAFGESEKMTGAKISKGSASTEIALNPGQENKAVLDAAPDGGTPKLDLMIMLDTTGSMSDELSYLTSEIGTMLSELNVTADVKTSVNFYRDVADRYVVKANDFADASAAAALLRNETCDGGGDMPEAVDQALRSVVDTGVHTWRDGAVKIAFLVLDAPAHDDAASCERIKAAVKTAAAEGIRLIPVMASGADEACETMCRTMALLTGGEFIFLTDHSGIGNAHRAPETSVEYEVKPLITVMIEAVRDYL